MKISKQSWHYRWLVYVTEKDPLPESTITDYLMVLIFSPFIWFFLGSKKIIEFTDNKDDA